MSCISLVDFGTVFLHFSILKNQFGEGNGTPLQYSCLENPMDGGAWWAAVHQAPPSMGFSRQEYWSGVPLPSPN